MTIRNSTFTANGSNNGAVLADSGTVNLYNNIFANSDSGADCYRNNITGAIVNFSAGASNLIETNAVAPNNCGVAVTNYIAADPDLGTLTGSPGYYPLNVSSPAINVGDVATCNTIDTIGTDRTTTYAPCDLGAFESLVVATCTDVTVTSFAQLSAAITDYNTNCIAGDTKTVTVSVPVTDTITYTGTLPTISNATNATLTIQDGTLNGVDTYLLLTITNGNVTLNNMDLLDGDSTGAYSGGINNAGTLTIINSRFTGNRSNGNGGAIYNSGIATVTGSTFTNNTVSAGGGAISNHNQLIVSNSTFTGGIAGSGGAIYSQFSLQVSNSTFSNNQAAFGGGAIHNRFTATATLTNNTFSANTDTGNQGGAVYTGLGATTTLQNNILANSTSGIDCYKNASTVTFSAGTSNLIETDAGGANACGVAGTNYINADPDLGTLTGSPAYFPLNILSPAINAGENAVCPATDIQGTGRPTGPKCDLGAIEASAPTCTNVSVSSFAQLSSAINIYNTACGNGNAMTITVNGSITYGGAVAAINNVTTATLTITGGTLDGASGYRLLEITNGNVTLSGMTLQNGNVVSIVGGAAISNSDSLTVNNSRFFTNTVSNDGGAVYNAPTGTATITASTFSGNQATSNFGGAIRNNGTLSVTNSTFKGNSTPGNGGAVYNQGGATLTLRNNTFAQNSVVIAGADLYNNGTLFLYNNIMADSAGGENCYTNGGTITLSAGTSNLIESNPAVSNRCGTLGTQIIAAEPYLGTFTGSPNYYYPLQVVSPAINAGDAATCAATDVLGTNRTTTYSPCDLGAFESNTLSPTCSDVTVTGFPEFLSALNNYNTVCGNGNAMTITIFGTVTYDGTVTTINNATTARLTIQNGTLDGDGNYRLLNIANGDVTLTSLTLANANAPGLSGGAVYNADLLTVNGSLFQNNMSGSYGGALYNALGTAIIRNSTFLGNSSGTSAGAIENTGTLTIQNSSFSGNNTPGFGGAVFNEPAATMTLVNNTFTNNRATLGGTDVYTDGILTLNNNILANPGNAVGNCYRGGGTVAFSTGASNLIEAQGTNPCGTVVTNYINTDPALGTIADFPGHYPPSNTSAAINAGVIASCTTADVKATVRPVGTACDLGAVEVTFATPTITSVTVAPNPILVDQTAAFNASATSPGTIVSYAWDIDNNGTFSDAAGANHNQGWPGLGGIYGWSVATSPRMVAVRVTDNLGQTTTATTNVVVNAATPITANSGGAGGFYTMYEGETLVLDASASTPASGQTITQYRWDIDNNGSWAGPNDYTETVPTLTLDWATLSGTHGFYVDDPNVFDIPLEITDSAANTATTNTFLTIRSAKPIINATADNSANEGNLTDTATLAIRLPKAPIATENVEVDLTTNGQCTLNIAMLTFNDQNYATAQTVIVTAVNDLVAEGAHTCIVTATIDVAATTDATYDGVAPVTHSVNIVDNASVALNLIVTDATTSEDNEQGQVALVLGTQPGAGLIVEVDLTTDGQCTLSDTTITFNNGNWSNFRYIVVSGTPDGLPEGAHPCVITATVDATAAGRDNTFDGQTRQNYVVVSEVSGLQSDYYDIRTNNSVLLEILAPGVLANDTNVQSGTVELENDVSFGTLTLRANGSFEYLTDPNAGATVDGFRYSVLDSGGI